MIYRKLLLLAAGAAFTFGMGAGAPALAASSARLCKVYYIENKAPLNSAGQCVSPFYLNEGGLCVARNVAHNAFSYIINADDTLDFGLSFWFGSGAHCGIIGKAKPAGNGWRYESGLDSADKNERCAVTIRLEKEFISFDADPNASCRAQCGAQAQLRGTVLPLNAVDPTPVTQQSLRPEIFYNQPCRQ